MWEITGAGGISSGTSSAAREDSDWLQPWPGGPMGAEHPSNRAALPGKAGTWFTEKNTMLHNDFLMPIQGAYTVKNVFSLVSGVCSLL